MLSCDWVGVVCMGVCVLEGLEGLPCDWVGVGGCWRELLYLEKWVFVSGRRNIFCFRCAFHHIKDF